MDSLTHIVLGATVGELMAGRRLGKKAMLFGAIAQSLPDIDAVAGFWLDTAHDVVAHRGITHSFFFLVLVSPLLAWIFRRWFRNGGVSWGSTIWFFAFGLFMHIFLDAFNAYGTGWFEPFSHQRIAFNVLFVADPLFTIWLVISTVALLILKAGRRARVVWAVCALALSGFYLNYCVINKFKVDKWTKHALALQHIPYQRYFTTPTPMNSLLWYIVAEDSLGYHSTYMSVFDKKYPTDFYFFPRNDSLLEPLKKMEDVTQLLRFADGYYTVEKWTGSERRFRHETDTIAGIIAPEKDTVVKAGLGEDSAGRVVRVPNAGVAGGNPGDSSVGDTLVFNVLRFGQMKGWENGRARYVFHYFLQRPGDNMVVLQRGRFAGWSRKTVDEFIRRIGGN